ncbi:MAG: enoyl-CoA hydratase/isomerase family protein [Pseudomonadota bacterium]
MIKLEDTGPVWTVTLARSDKANALTHDMLDQLVDIAERAHVARALILTGEGRVFSAGADLDAARAGLATSPLWERLSGAIAAVQGLTIAALNGTVAGGAMGMVLACDLRLGVSGTKFFYPVLKLGFLPQPSDPGRLARLVGPAQAKFILLGGQKVTAQDALRTGLLDEIVPADSLMQRAQDLTTDCVASAPEIPRAIKAMIDGGART